MTTAPTTKKFHQLVDIEDNRYSNNCSNIDYGHIACDCETKTISILEAINHISLSIFSLAEDDGIDKEKLEIFPASSLTLQSLGLQQIRYLMQPHIFLV